VKFRQDIQALRGIAVSGVVLFHAFPSIVANGYLGVDLFFVISGYVVTPLILRIAENSKNSRRLNFLHFLQRRFLRLGPALGVCILFSLLVFAVFGNFDDSTSVLGQLIYTLFFLGNLGAYKFQGDYFASKFNPFVHTWSLSLEEQIYIFLPIAYLICLIFVRRTRLTLLLLYLVASLISFYAYISPISISYGYALFGAQIPELASFYSPISRLWQFLIGGVVYLISLNGLPKILQAKKMKLMNLVTTAIILFIIFGKNIQVSSSILITLVGALCIYLRSFNLLSFRCLTWLGDRSYSIYLYHLPLIYFAMFSPLNSQYYSELEKYIRITIGLIVTIIISNYSFKYVENKFRGDKNLKLPGRKFLILFLLFWALPLFSSFSAYAVVTDSFKNSYSMYDNMFFDGECRFWKASPTEINRENLMECSRKFGRGVAIIGDSHALNVYNSIARESEQSRNFPFILGISMGGCRFSDDNRCLESIVDFLTQNRNYFKGVYYHQSGSYFIEDQNGKVDSGFAFVSDKSFVISSKRVDAVKLSLQQIDLDFPIYWIGPFTEGRFVATPWQVFIAKNLRMNKSSVLAFQELDAELLKASQSAKRKFSYISINHISMPPNGSLYNKGCFLFRDVDHWSYCGEYYFGSALVNLLTREDAGGG
jgi:peptidoglycan/LPS O-acetylase OafA/YrhL